MLLPALLLSALLPSAVGDGASAITLGRLTFNACELTRPQTSATTAAFCAPFEVPENWDEPNGRKIALKLAIVRAESATPQSDPVVFLAGGPGQAATETYPAMVGALSSLRKNRHILLLDQRGTGGSNRLECKLAEVAVSESAAFDPERVKQRTQECLKTFAEKSDVRYYTTSDAVRDLEAVRLAIGSVQFNLVGVSYGTRMAQAYMRYAPAAVRSAILDGVVPNEMILGMEFSTALEAALKAQFDQCKKRKECSERFGDPYATLYRVRDRLRAKPLKVTTPNPDTFEPVTQNLDANALAGLVRMFAYSAETAALLPLTLDRALHEDYVPLLGQYKLLIGELDANITDAMQLAVICSEDADRLTVRAEDRDTLLGTAIVQSFQAACGVWPHGNNPEGFHTPLKSDTPTLLLSGEYDPVTPPRYGEQVLQGLGNGRHLVAKGQGHNVIARGCIPRLATKFVEQLKPKELDTACMDDFGPVPAFIDFNGAGP